MRAGMLVAIEGKSEVLVIVSLGKSQFREKFKQKPKWSRYFNYQ
jgi:hypothetical protein